MQEAVFATTLMAAGNINVYDIRKECVGSMCYDFSLMEEYLGQPEVKQALGVEGRSWVECNAIVYGDFIADWMLEVPSLSLSPPFCVPLLLLVQTLECRVKVDIARATSFLWRWWRRGLRWPVAAFQFMTAVNSCASER